MPCRFPLKWHVGNIESGFQVSRSTVRRAAQQALQAWEKLSERSLFEHTPGEGLPIHLRFDRRQREMRAFLEQHQRLNNHQLDIEGKRQELSRREQQFQQSWEAYQRKREELSQRIEEFNQRVQQLSNSQGGVSPSQKERLDRRRRSLDNRQRELEERGRDLQSRQQQLQQAQEQLNQWIAEYNRASERFNRDFSTNIREAGQYVEQVKIQGEQILDVSDRRIHIFLFADPSSLSWVLAHEFGHAMGLGHIGKRGSIMSTAFNVLDVGVAPPRATTSDRRLLSRACPELFGSS